MSLPKKILEFQFTKPKITIDESKVKKKNSRTRRIHLQFPPFLKNIQVGERFPPFLKKHPRSERERDECEDDRVSGFGEDDLGLGADDLGCIKL